tara:strand:- start:9428 stop:10981 length:1554 start_codon:yes stop_codon:yes gene_type:complete
MGLIYVHGLNPFSGQSDPYLSMSSNITYENGKGEIVNTYSLNGVLTGCSKSSLINAQNSLVNYFDWKNDPTIPQNIEIRGVVGASASSQLIPTSLSFNDSNYIGSVGYSLNIELFTGVASEDDELINKTHTETTNIDEKECVSISTSISCEPNQNLTGCGALEAANKWISGQLGKTKLGEITRTKNLPLKSESLTINPITSAISYSSTHGQECDDTTNAGTPHSGFQLAYCSELNLRDTNCPSGLSDTAFNGEVYKSGASEQDLTQYFNTGFLVGYPNKKTLKIDYNNQNDSINFSFSSLMSGDILIYEPQDLILDDYTISKNINHDDDTVSTSINGNVFILNPVAKEKSEVLEMTDDEILNRARTYINAEGKVQSTSVSRNQEAGEISYSIEFSDGDEAENDNPISDYSVSYKPSLYSYNVQPTLCGSVIHKSQCPKRGSVDVSVTAISGTGWDYVAKATSEATRLYQTFGGGQPSFRIEDQDLNFSDDKASVTKTFRGSFLGAGVNDSTSISSMF